MTTTVKTKVFIDLDDTLLNTLALKRAIAELCASFGFDHSEIISAYNLAREDYTVEQHLKILSETTGKSYDESRARSLIGSLKSKLKDFLFAETEIFLSSLDRQQFEYYLFTFGNPDFQSWKIEGSGLSSYFDEEHTLKISHEGKAHELHDIVGDSENFLMIDDKLTELNTAEEIFGDRVETISVFGGDLLSRLAFLCKPAEGSELIIR